ncbi:MAG: hypothetical protein IPG61_03275 [bacterium]|nr:hypothetical protein [bacterium]
MGYNLKPWLTLEGFAGLSISEYSSTIENRRVRKNEAGAVPDEDPPLGDFDAEARSLITLQTGVDALIYPFNFSGDGGGRWHPYLTGQVGKIWYDMNSDFTAGAAGSNDIAFGGGLRLLAERNVSIRLEATYHMNSIEFKPAEYFRDRRGHHAGAARGIPGAGRWRLRRAPDHLLRVRGHQLSGLVAGIPGLVLDRRAPARSHGSRQRAALGSPALF